MTVDITIAKVILKNNGIYPGDPQALVVIRYRNQWLKHNEPAKDFSICFTSRDIQAVYNSSFVISPELCWSRTGGLTTLGEEIIAQDKK